MLNSEKDAENRKKQSGRRVVTERAGRFAKKYNI